MLAGRQDRDRVMYDSGLKTVLSASLVKAMKVRTSFLVLAVGGAPIFFNRILQPIKRSLQMPAVIGGASDKVVTYTEG